MPFREEYGKLYDFVQQKKLKIKNRDKSVRMTMFVIVWRSIVWCLINDYLVFDCVALYCLVFDSLVFNCMVLYGLVFDSLVFDCLVFDSLVFDCMVLYCLVKDCLVFNLYCAWLYGIFSCMMVIRIAFSFFVATRLFWHKPSCSCHVFCLRLYALASVNFARLFVWT